MPKGYISKLLLIMKLTCVIIIMALMQVSAATFGQNLTLKEDNVSISKIFYEIRKQTGYDVLVKSDRLNTSKKIDASFNNVPVKVVLDKLIEGTELEYAFNKKVITIKMKESSLLERITKRFQNIDVTGKIVDEKGEAIAGATIKVKGTNITTSSNYQGIFTLKNVEEKAVLEVSYLGYQTREVKAAVDLGTITLEVEVGELSEVAINAGYYTVRQRELTGSISRVTAKEIANQPVTNVLSSLQGRMAGVNITQNSGVPGGGYKVEIRGQNSLRTILNGGLDGNLPLYVVDGSPIGAEITAQFASSAIRLSSINPLNTIAPQDIESIEVLKDADATAIYGSRGANGVVLITTKKGKSGKMGLSFNSLFSVSSALSNLEMMNTEQYLDMRKQAYKNSGVSEYLATAYDLNGIWDQNRYTNWRDELIGGDAKSSDYQLSLNGGNSTTSFLLSFGHQQQATVYPSDFKYKTTSISNSLNHRSADSRFHINLSNRFSNQKNNVINEDLTRIAYVLSPNAPSLYNADGSLNWQNNTFNNPVATYNGTYDYNNVQFLNNLNLEYELLKNFKVKLNGGINYLKFEEWSLRPHTVNNPAFASGQSSFYSQSNTSNFDRFSYNIEPQLNWLMQKDKHRFEILAGTTYQRETSNKGSLRGSGFQSNNFIRNIGSAQNRTLGEQANAEYRYAALYGRINYQFDGKYILNITGRRDGSSRFGPNNKYANFAAAGAAWLFSEENFMKENSWLSFGKLRGSFGTSGNDNIGDYQYFNTFSISATSLYDGVTGIIPSRLFNPDFSWEKTTKLEVALEMGFFKDRLNLTAAYYSNRSSNQLIGYQLPAITGFSSVNANLNATVQNTGFELDAQFKVSSTRSVQWQTGFNISVPRNKLISFPGLAGSSYANAYVIGQPVNIVRLYHLEGINNQTGEYQFTDYNGDGKITSPQDRQVVENLGVRYFGGWNNQLKYKNINLSFLVQFVNQKSRNYNTSMSSPGQMNNLPVQALNVWSSTNPTGFYMPYKYGSIPLHSLMQTSDASVSDGSFLRLKNIQLSYQIPSRNKSVFKNLSISLQGHNIFTVTNYFGIDPETAAAAFLPPLKTYSLGVKFNL